MSWRGGHTITPPTDNRNLPIYKLVVVGDGGVGKSAITLQLIQKTFIADYDPTIEDNYHQHCDIDGNMCLLDVWDTAGQDEYSVMREQYMRKGDGFLLVYSVTDVASFDNVPNFYRQILRVKGRSTFPVLLVANKVDLDHLRMVTSEEGQAMAERLGLNYIETSAKDPPLNVDLAFHETIRLIRGHPDNEEKKEKKRCNIL